MPYDSHTACVTTAFLHAKNINVMDWPSMSPDLSPIEHVWDMLDRGIHQHPVQPQTFTATGTGAHSGVEWFAFECYPPLYWVNGSSLRGSYLCCWWPYQILRLVSPSFCLCFVRCNEIFPILLSLSCVAKWIILCSYQIWLHLCKMNELWKNEFSFALEVSFSIYIYIINLKFSVSH